MQMDYSTITTLRQAEECVRAEHLTTVLLLPRELGGQEFPENRVFIPPQVQDGKAASTAALIEAVGNGLTEISIVPEHRGQSFVQSRIAIRGGASGSAGSVERDIKIW